MLLGPLNIPESHLVKRKGIALFNSASPWASDENDLQSLYDSPYTSLVTTRTAVVTQDDVAKGLFMSTFSQHSSVHAHSFLRDVLPTHDGGRLNIARGSLNSYGYSPHALSEYLEWIKAIWEAHDAANFSDTPRKPFIISITGPPEALEHAIVAIRQWTAAATKEQRTTSSFVAVEINLSCPNIKGNDAPSGYDTEAIVAYIASAQRANDALSSGSSAPRLAISLKLPPYTYPAQFDAILHALEAVKVDKESAHPITFLTSTNTLGGCLWFNVGQTPNELNKALPVREDFNGATFDGTGGLAGESLHPVALGNVYTLHRRLQASLKESVRKIQLIGVGGVMSGTSAFRMQAAGAHGVALATALGREGVSVFERISNEILLEGQGEDHDG